MEILRKKQPIAKFIELEVEPTTKKKSNYEKTKEEINKGSWCEENKELKAIFYYTSYFAAAISLSSAFFWVVSAIGAFFTGAIIPKIFGGGSLGLLEYFDRLSSKRFWKDWFFYRTIHKFCLAIALVIFVGSLFLSIDGEQAAKESAKASPKTIATNTLLEEKKAEKDSLQIVYNKIKTSPSSYKYPKTMTTMWWPTQKAQKSRNDAILALGEDIRSIQQEIKGENHLLTTTHINKVEKIGNVFLVLVFIFAVYYQFCIGWLAYYERQEYNEEELKAQLTALHYEGVKITPTLATEVLDEIKKPLKRKMKIKLNF
jgi:hypothetical protein